MRNHNILAAFSNERVLGVVEKALASENIRLAYSCKSVSELKKSINYCQGGIIICGYKLKDGAIVQFSESERVFKLIVPLKKDDLICSVYMLLSMGEGGYTRKTSFRTSEEEKIIRKAKEILIDRYNLTEEQAHKYLQKKSMDTGRKIIDVAKLIL